jgi:tetratricopeptide (TPR) repeat protein
MVERIERFPIFLVLAAVALAAGFALSPWRRRALAAAAVILALTVGDAAAQAPPLPAVASPAVAAAPAPPPQPDIPWWQRWLPGGVRRLARSGQTAWDAGDTPAAAEAFAGAATLDPTSADRLYDLGTALAAGGQLEPALQLLTRAGAAGAPAAAFNAGTAALTGGQAEPAVEWLRQAVLADPDDADAKRNLELALQLLEQQQQQQQDQQDDQKQDDQKQDEQQQGQPTPTPQPTPSGGQGGPPPTPTPDPAKSIFAALERAEAEAREGMQSPTPQVAKVEKDW